MKKIICLILTVAMIFSTADVAFAKKHNNDKNNKKQESYEKKDKSKDDKQEFKIDDSPVIKYGNYKLPIAPITKGMGATVSFDKNTAVLTITKDAIKIEIYFKEKVVYVNGVKDDNSGIFTASNGKKTVVLIKYIAKLLGIRCDIDDDEIIVDVPDLDLPTEITLIPVGGTVVANTLNSTTLYLTASAKITAGKATGGRAELYVDNTKVATDASIAGTDTLVTFSTSDGTPTNAELQTIVPKGGVVTVQLYDVNNKVVTSKVANPTLTVDYIAPIFTGITSATYHTDGNQIKLNVTGASAVGDTVDVTRIVLNDAVIGRSYQLTNNSTGVVKSSELIEINLGTLDKLGLAGFGSASTYLTIATGSLLRDSAGNVSPSFTTTITVPVSVATALDAPTNVIVSPFGSNVANTLNSTTIYMDASASIKAGQATGGRAELYVGNKLIAVDNTIGATDTTVTFTTSDGTPTNSELQTIVPAGGVVTVKLYNAYNNSVSSTVGNPTLTVDYIVPTLASISSVIYNVPNNQLYLIVNGAGTVGDKVDVTKLTLYDSTLGRSYQLTNSATTGSTGTVISSTSILVSIGAVDKMNLSGFGSSSVYLTVASGALLTDAAGNSSSTFTANQTLPVTLVK